MQSGSSHTYTPDECSALAERILSVAHPHDTQATIVALQGNLGAGKTTLTQELAARLGVAEPVISPTFVIAKFYSVEGLFTTLIHVDAYRIEDVSELKVLGFDELLQQPRTLIVIEWPESIAKILPPETLWFSIEHAGEKRVITRTQ